MQQIYLCFEPVAGLGHFIHTYAHDGNPIPTFSAEPERVAIPDSIDEFFSMIWDTLDSNNKISLVVRYINIETGDTEEMLINGNEA